MTPSQRRWERALWPLALVGVGLLLQGVLAPAYYPGLYHDDACYLLRAWALVNRGRCPVCDQALTQGLDYPLGWPVLLMPWALWSPERLLWAQGVSLALTLASAVLLWWTARRFWGEHVAGLLGLSFLASSGSLWFGASTMTEPLFVFQILVLLSFAPGQRWAGVVALVAAWCVVTRTEGLVVLLALLLGWAAQRRWGDLAKAVSASLALGAWMTWLRPTASPHWKQVAEFAPLGLLEQIQRWFTLHLPLMAQCWLGGGQLWVQVVTTLLLVVAVRGVWLWWRREPGPGPWLAVLLPLALFLWPYLHLRYWYPLWPVLLLAVPMALPERGRVPLLAALLLGQTCQAVIAPKSDHSAVLELYGVLRETPKEAVATGLYGCRTHLYSHRATRQPAQARSVAELAVFMATSQSSHVLWESRPALIADLRGQHQGAFQPDLDLWIERAPLFRVVGRNSAGLVAELVWSPAQVEQAFARYREIFLAPDPAARWAAVQALAQVAPDFPGLQFLQGISDPDRERAGLALLAHGRRYPHDFLAIREGLALLAAWQETETAQRLAGYAADEAVRLGRAGELTWLRPWLVVEPGKGGALNRDERPAP